MNDDEVTLEELSARTGVEPRTLRSWISEGLLSPPFKPGRGARYPAANADRALAIRVLKDTHGLSLSEISRRFMLATQEQIQMWALEANSAAAPSGSAREYLRILRERSSGTKYFQKSMDFLPDKKPTHKSQPQSSMMSFSNKQIKNDRIPRHVRQQAELASLERLILQLEDVLGTRAPRRSRGTIWTRIPVTSDLEISVRGQLEPRERTLFEQLADQLRAILTGGPSHD